VAEIFTTFSTALGFFKNIKYDILDTEKNEFETDLNKFHDEISDLDRRIG
jgi:dynein heavy chain